MERLTFKVHDGGMFVRETDIKTFNVEDEVMYTGNAIRKLAEYEDAEEQGLLLRLPCKVGDTIYVIPSKVNYELNIINGHAENNRVYKQKVYSIQMFSNARYLLTACEGYNSVLSDFYKATWFLTPEEAEQALTEMQVK